MTLVDEEEQVLMPVGASEPSDDELEELEWREDLSSSVGAQEDAFAYANALLSPYLESWPWWISYHEVLDEGPWLLKTVIPESLVGSDDLLLRIFQATDFGYILHLNRWTSSMGIVLGVDGASDREYFISCDSGIDKREKFHINIYGDLQDSIVPKNCASMRQAAFCAVPQDVTARRSLLNRDFDILDPRFNEILNSLKTSEWRLAVRTLALVDGGPTVILLPNELLSSEDGEEDRRLLLREGLVRQVFKLPNNRWGADNPSRSTLVRLGTQEIYYPPSSSISKDNYAHVFRSHLSCGDIRFTDASMEHTREHATISGEAYEKLMRSYPYTRWVSREDIEVGGCSFDAGIELGVDTSDKCHLESITSQIRRGIPKTMPEGRASLETIYGSKAAESSTDWSNYRGDNICFHLPVADFKNGAIVEATEAFSRSEYRCQTSSLSEKRYVRSLRTGSICRLCQDEEALMIFRAGALEQVGNTQEFRFKVFLVRNRDCPNPVLFTVSDSVFICKMKRDSATGERLVDSRYLLAFLVSAKGQHCLNEAMADTKGILLGAKGVASLEVPMPSLARQAEVGAAFQAQSEEADSEEEKTYAAHRSLILLADKLFAG